MTGPYWSSPFGARPISAVLMTAEMRLRERQKMMARERENSGAPPNEGRVADKWQLLRALSEGRGRFALSDRTICVLEALLSFQPGKEIDGSEAVIVFPSNRELSLRSRGMAPATLRRHLAALVEAQLIVRRDSPNGKRFRRIDPDGEGDMVEAFGFDLSPLAMKAGEIFAAAEIERRTAREVARLRSAISIHRRDVRKVLEAALEEGRPGSWTAFLERLAVLTQPLVRGAALSVLAVAEAGLVRLRAEVENAYLATLSDEEMSASDAEGERHLQNSNTDLPSESNGHRHNTGGNAENGRQATAGRKGEERAKRAPETRGLPVDLASVLRLCPEIADYARAPIATWRDLAAVADLVRGFLGISPDAWNRAREAMGEFQAAIVVAAMLTRAERISSPGGYLRALTAKARQGRFTVEPMLKALE